MHAVNIELLVSSQSFGQGQLGLQVLDCPLYGFATIRLNLLKEGSFAQSTVNNARKAKAL